jgi:drug/metabolite transporter (DMT)-like permease
MSGAAAGLVLGSSALHLLWNAHTRSEAGRLIRVWWMVAYAGLFSAVAAGPEWATVSWARVWPYLAATAVIHAVYFPAVAWMYREGELGWAYPIARGGAAVPAALLAWVWRHETLGVHTWLGVALIVVGVGVAELGTGGSRPRDPRRWWPVLLVLLTVTAYSVVDSQAARSIPALPYMACLSGGAALLLVPVVRPRLRWTGWGDVLAGIQSAGSYLLLLAAYPLAPLAAVMALRQVAPALAPLVGSWRLGEVWTPSKMAAAVLVAGGAAVVVWH